ncbi:hypothetical protein EZV73_16420 [Acidaminobacter sp. JC074]|uniref:DUF5693 family protein n=1 Tax=Acidaminobacter sp. JC074 TaxID=2530199 RepID=UPI001F0DB304|nr:DUF5693 family protein [Acidaminobacter sp. JC074]MCH4889182.1 hypothetical protein [Acidaminobacter sp. JC074]
MKKNIVYILLIILLVVTTGINVMDRMAVENAAKTVEITLSYDDMVEMSDQSDEDVVWWFNEFSKLGVESVALTEETFQTLVDQGYELELKILHNLKKDTLWEMRYPAPFVDYVKDNEIDLNDVVVVSDDQDLKDFIIKGLDRHYPKDFYTLFEEGDHYAFLLDGLQSEVRYTQIYKNIDTDNVPVKQIKDVHSSAIYDFAIDFDPDKIQNIKDGNLQVNLRPWNNKRFPDKLIDAYDEALNMYDIKATNIIFAGKEILGYPDKYVELYDYLSENNITPVLIETGVQRSNVEQEDLFQLVEDMNYQSVRALPLVSYLQERFEHYNYDGGQEIENVMFRGITERNMRIIYFRPFKLEAETYVTDIDEYKISFERLQKRLDDHDIKLGKFSVMPYKSDNLWSGIIIGFGLVSIMILASRYFFKLPAWFEYVTLVVGGLLVAAALLVAPNFGRQLLALAAAVIISCLGSVILIAYAKDLIGNRKVLKLHEIIGRSILFTLAMSALALLGGMIVGGLLSHSKYLLEIEFFRGVKVSEILPLVVFVVLYLLKFGYNRSVDEIKSHDILPKDLLRFLNVEIKVSYLLATALGGVILYIYIARSGHETTVQPSDIEMIFRNFLELVLLARPRLKEFLIAVPAMMMFAYISYKGYKPLVALVGLPAVITFTSIINTFSHLRAPIYLSIVRTLLGIGFGLVIGLIGILVFDGIIRLVKRIKKRYLAYESEEKELGA